MAATAVQTSEVLAAEIADLKMIVPRIHRDHRGFFSEMYNKAGLTACVNLEFVQDNHSLSLEREVARGAAFSDSPVRAGQTCTLILGSRLLTSITFTFRKETLTYEVLEGWWTDAGTFESLLRANNLVAKTGSEQIDGRR